ncbi:MAG TPA: bifunctional (p)ppGpp synthetase/guanosine-3',5'-bis(diphosphate) 3'-pyrophosphohydrolase [Chthonomonadales bacterium]|nr:bifunctional (p)ppGpp synthetase/guanosine-3',5'-bis(diphosphate) 3'-pyrophosphohydrolase [Chthonomonadales bacterium]
METQSRELFEGLLHKAREKRPDVDAELLARAYERACELHRDQARRSGEPYVCHPIAVATILADLEMDTATLAAGLLHDVIEDTADTQEDLAREFGAEVAGLVEGVSKLKMVGADTGLLRSPTETVEVAPADEARARRRQETFRTASNLRRIFLAMAKDLRVMVIKLADRLHNMRTLDAMPEDKRKRIARETLEIFAPLAHRLGIWQMKAELEDLAFRHSEPEQFAEMERRIAHTTEQLQTEIDEANAILRDRLVAEGVRDPHVTGRRKHLYGIYQKMLKQELDLEDIYDILALRVIVHTRQECYHALGVVSGLWTPIPGMFADYVARGKSNMYQSLHIKVVGPRAKPLEVQIRTWEMHRTAEFGVAAHWAYKEKGEGSRAEDQFERKLSWLRQQLFDWQTDSRDSGEFLRSVTEDLFTDQVFVFTPMGDVLDLPAGATPIDFAYRIHSDIGNKAVGAKVNGRLVPLSYQFHNGDVVEIITRSNSSPSRDWLAITKTSHARAKIRAFFRRLHHGESVERGRELLAREAERLGIEPAALKDEALRGVAPHFNVPNEEELLAGVGYGTIALLAVLNRLRPEQPPHPKGIVIGRGRTDESSLRVTAGNVDNVMFRRSRCCQPIPGDEVVGYITRGRGIALHRTQCPNIRHAQESEPERLITVDYAGGDNSVYGVNLQIESMDRTGLLADVGTVFGELKTNITAVKTQSHRDHTASLCVVAEVRDVEHLARVFQAVRRLPDVIDVSRQVGGREK